MKRRKLNRNVDDEEGAIGIGTMIVFVGLLIVSAVAVTVILNTSDDLRSTAGDTAQDVDDSIVPPVEVTRIEGNVSAVEDDMRIKDMQVYITIPEGRDAYNIEDSLIVQIDGSDAGEEAFSETFVYRDNSKAGDPYPAYNATIVTNTTHSSLPIVSSGSIVRLDFVGLDVRPGMLGNQGLSPDSAVNFEFMTTFGGHGTRETTRTPSEYPREGWIRFP